MRTPATRPYLMLVVAVGSPAAAETSIDAMIARARALTSEPKCGTRQDGDDIVICAKKDPLDDYKLSDTPSRVVEPILPPADFGLFGKVRAGLRAEQLGRPDGLPDKRIKVTLKIPF